MSRKSRGAMSANRARPTPAQSRAPRNTKRDATRLIDYYIDHGENGVLFVTDKEIARGVGWFDMAGHADAKYVRRLRRHTRENPDLYGYWIEYRDNAGGGSRLTDGTDMLDNLERFGIEGIKGMHLRTKQQGSERAQIQMSLDGLSGQLLNKGWTESAMHAIQAKMENEQNGQPKPETLIKLRDSMAAGI